VVGDRFSGLPPPCQPTWPHLEGWYEMSRVGLVLGRGMAGMLPTVPCTAISRPPTSCSSGEGVPCLVDFALATPFAELHPELIHHQFEH
jgi:hypothetical protein